MHIYYMHLYASKHTYIYTYVHKTHIRHNFTKVHSGKSINFLDFLIKY